AALVRGLAGFDVVHGHGQRASFWAERAARRARVPVFIAAIHELRWQTVAKSIKRAVWLAIERGVLGRAQGLITVSEATRRDLIAHWPELAPKTRAVHASAPMLLRPADVPHALPAHPTEVLRLV